MKADDIRWEILEDGTISVTTDQVSGVNHVSAERLLEQLFNMVGGEVKRTKRMPVDINLVPALHEHAADGHTHGHGHGHHHH
jgi:hypothetical protein